MNGIKYISYGDCSIRVYRLFTAIFHKCLLFLVTLILQYPIMLALCLMLSMTHYPQNYAGIIGGSLLITTKSTKPATAHPSQKPYTVLHTAS